MCPVGNGNGGRGSWSLGNILDKFTRGSGRKLNVESIFEKFTLCFGADHFDFLKYFGLECVRKKLPQATVRFPFVLGGYMRARKSSRALTFINIIFFTQPGLKPHQGMFITSFILKRLDVDKQNCID